MRFNRQARGPSAAVRAHYKEHFGDPFAVLEEKVPGGDRVEFPGFSDTPWPGKVTMATNGLSTLSRRRGFASGDGLADELVMVIGGGFLGDDFIDFFVELATVYSRHAQLLEWHEPIRLGTVVPGSDDMNYLLSVPTAMFEESFAFLEEPAGTTVMRFLLPLREVEVNAATSMDELAFHTAMEKIDPEYWDLQRPLLDLR